MNIIPFVHLLTRINQFNSLDQFHTILDSTFMWKVMRRYLTKPESSPKLKQFQSYRTLVTQTILVFCQIASTPCLTASSQKLESLLDVNTALKQLTDIMMNLTKPQMMMVCNIFQMMMVMSPTIMIMVTPNMIIILIRSLLELTQITIIYHHRTSRQRRKFG